MDIDNEHGFLPKINRLTDWLNCEQSSPVEADEVTNLRNQEDACHSSEQTTQYRDGRATCARQTNGFLGRLTLAWLLGRRVASGIALTCFLSLVGCTTQLQVMSDEADIGKLKDPKGGPLEGVIYYLPSVEFDITATWRLVSCNDDKADARLSFELAERYVADHSRPFVIDYKMLEAWLKHTDLEVLLYPNGTLRSINGDVQDKAGTVVPSLLELTSSAVDTAHTLEGRSGQSHCNPVAEQAMKQRVDLSKQIIKLKAKIAEISSRDPLDNCDKKELRQAKENLGIKRSALAEYSKQSSHKQSISWMPSHGTDKTTIKMVPRGRRKLFGEGNYTAPNLCITATLQPYDLPKGIVRSDTNPGKHLIYRAPAAAILEFRFADTIPRSLLAST